MKLRYCTLKYNKLTCMFDIEHYSFSDACTTPQDSRSGDDVFEAVNIWASECEWKIDKYKWDWLHFLIKISLF